jgi:biopolymer transport protein ExbD
LIGGVIALIAVVIIGVAATRRADESAARAAAEAPRLATIRIAPDGALTWNGLTVTDLVAHATAERAKPGPLTVIIEPDAKSPAAAPQKLLETLKQAGFPEGTVSIQVSMETLRDLEGL